MPGLVIRKRFAETQPEEWHKQINAACTARSTAATLPVRCWRPQATAGSFRSWAIHRGSANPALPSVAAARAGTIAIDEVAGAGNGAASA